MVLVFMMNHGSMLDFRPLGTLHLNQSTQDFYWCIHIDKNMPINPKQRLIDLVSSRSNIYVIEQDYWKSWDGIKKVIDVSGATHIITTKIDDDDALALNYVEDINF